MNVIIKQPFVYQKALILAFNTSFLNDVIQIKDPQILKIVLRSDQLTPLI